MDMAVEYRLACCFSDVDPDIEGLNRGVGCDKQVSYTVQQLVASQLLLDGQLEI